jgi:serine phosphatase RsbU (regulator of sigma subunit)
MGYEYDPSAGLFRKDKIEIQGTLDTVTLNALQGNTRITQTKSNSSGDFTLSLKIGSIYQLKYIKKGYAESAVTIDLTSIPEDLSGPGLLLTNIELLLNHHQSDKAIDNGKTIGLIKYKKATKQFEFTPQIYDKQDRMFKDEEDNAVKNLLRESIKSNSKNNKKPYNNSSSSNLVSTSAAFEENRIQSVHPQLSIPKNGALAKIENWSNITREDIESRAEEIQNAWVQIEKDKLIALTLEDSLIIQARTELLKSAEKELEAAKAFIHEQQEKISAQNWFNLILSLGSLALAAFIFILLKRNTEKKEANLVLAAKNKKITDSINYAERIQRSILLSDLKIKEIFPNSFIYHKPLAIVSGDFYWFSEVEGKKIFAAIDCTGHGVPGAFMSLIANTLLNKIVNEKKITSTSEILTELNKGISEALHQSSGDDFSQDGMDMSICAVDTSLNRLTFSGAMNHGFLIQNKELKELAADIIGIGGMIRPERLKKFKFQEIYIPLSKGDMVYLFSDGYMDQFGGTENKKFNLKQFKDLLIEVSSLKPKEQGKEIDKRFNNWRGNQAQIDDVLIVGVQI